MYEHFYLEQKIYIVFRVLLSVFSASLFLISGRLLPGYTWLCTLNICYAMPLFWCSTSTWWRPKTSTADLYRDAVQILGMSCTLSDSCRCLDCQVRIFFFFYTILYCVGGEREREQNKKQAKQDKCRVAGNVGWNGKRRCKELWSLVVFFYLVCVC